MSLVFDRPYVVSWNLTYRCNLACEHCYLDAGITPLVGTDNFADRSELGTEECFKVIDDIAAFAPECLTILTGGEPLLRRDILEIVRRAAERGLWVVVGTNGVCITENVARRLAEAGARGLSLSLDALDPDRHDRFRMVRGAWQNTVDGAEILNRTGLPFIVQTGHHRRAVRRGARVSLPNPAEIRPPDAREREVRTPLHQDRSGECRRRDRCEGQDLLGRGRRVSGRDALPGDPAERRCHAVPVPPRLRGEPAPRGAHGSLELLGTVHRHAPTRLARRPVRRMRDECALRGLSLSLDALDPDRHDRFRMVRGAWQNTVDGAEILNRTGLPFIVQTVVRAVEDSCRRNGISRVTAEELERIRARMPTPKMFG